MGSVEGRVALVTGASRGGTGTAAAVRLAAEGALVAITGRSVEGLEECRAQVEAVGGRCVVLPADLADPAGGRRELVAQVEAALGPVDILVNSAAMNGYKPFEEWAHDEIARVFEVNVLAPWELMQQCVPGMRQRGHGRIVNLTSFAGELPSGPPFPTNKPSKDGACYGSSKAALNRLTMSVASECEGQGIAVNALTPQAAVLTEALAGGGWIDDAMFEPLETMAEAILALATADPDRLTARIAYSLQLLVELDRPVYDLAGRELVEGWQPADLPAVIRRQAEKLAGRGWPDPFDFRRPHTPTPSPGWLRS